MKHDASYYILGESVANNGVVLDPGGMGMGFVDAESVYGIEDTIDRKEAMGGIKMAYVLGEKGEYIESLMNQSNDEWEKGNYESSLTLLEKAWYELPEVKDKYDESFLIISGLLDTSILTKDHDRLRRWVDFIFTADPERGDTGERDMWAGRVAYELGEFDKAKEYIKLADKKSKGRCFSLKNDAKYFKFYTEFQTP